MYSPTSLRSLPLYPVIGGTIIASLVFSFGLWLNLNVGPFFITPEWPRQPWRLFTATLMHGSILHLLFNLYWTWVFGTLLEQRYGHAKTAGMLLLLAATSMAAEFALFRGAIGLSGIGYGFFGFLWVASARDRRLYGAVDQNTVFIFVAWFFISIVLTIVRAVGVANVAHAVGALMGIMLGHAVTDPRHERRVAWAAAIFGATVLILLAASIGRPYVNFSRLF